MSSAEPVCAGAPQMLFTILPGKHDPPHDTSQKGRTHDTHIMYYIYPDACGNPATVPWQGVVVGIESDNDELLYIVAASFLILGLLFAALGP